MTLFTCEEGSEQLEEFSPEGSYQYLDKVSDLGEDKSNRPIFIILEFDRPVTIVPDCKGDAGLRGLPILNN